MNKVTGFIKAIATKKDKILNTRSHVENTLEYQIKYFLTTKKRIPSIFRGKSYSGSHDKPKELRTDFSRIIAAKEGIFPI